MRWLSSVFANRFNRFRKENGKLFQGRFKGIVLEDFDRLSWLCHYIHLNPVRAGICSVEELKDYRWGSYWYLRNRRKRPPFLDLSACLVGAGELKDSRPGWGEYAAYLNWLCEDEPTRKSMLFDRMSRGWVHGTKEFKEALLEDAKVRRAAIEFGEADLVEARELAWSGRLEACLEFVGVNWGEAVGAAKSAPWKAAIAAHLKSKLLCRNRWMGERLKMGSESGVSRLCSRVLSGDLKEASKMLEGLNAQFKE